MELNAHWSEFGSLAQLLSPEKRRIFRRINFEYLLLFNERSTEEMQMRIWSGVGTNLMQLQGAAVDADSSRQSHTATMTAPTPADIALQQTDLQTAAITKPVQDVDIFPKTDQVRSQLPLSGAAIADEVFRQAVEDIREALNGDKDHSKWLLIAAYKQLHKAVELNPVNPSAHFNIAWLSTFFFHKQPQAIRHLEAVVKSGLEKDTSLAIFALRHQAEIHRELENFDAAVEATNDAYMLDRQETPQIIFDLARYLTLAQQHEKAVHFLEALLEKYPEYYWQVLAEPDFSKNQEVAALTNALAKTYLGLDDMRASEPSESQFDESDLVALLEENERTNQEDVLFIAEKPDLLLTSPGETTDADEEPGQSEEQPIVVRQADAKHPSPEGHSYPNGHSDERHEEAPETATTEADASTHDDSTAAIADPVTTEASTPAAGTLEANGPETASAPGATETEDAASGDADSAEKNAAIPEAATGEVNDQELENMLSEVEDIVEQESKKTDDAKAQAGPAAVNETHFPSVSDAPATQATNQDRAEILDLLQQIGENLKLSPTTREKTATAGHRVPKPAAIEDHSEKPRATSGEQQDTHSEAKVLEKIDTADDTATDIETKTSAIAPRETEAPDQNDTANPDEGSAETTISSTIPRDSEKPSADLDTEEEQYETNAVLAKMGKKILMEPPEKSWPNPFKIKEPEEQPDNVSPDPTRDENVPPMSDLLMKVEENARRDETESAHQDPSDGWPALKSNDAVAENRGKTRPAEKPEQLAEIITELHHEAELAFQRCEKLDTVFTRKDKEYTQDKIQNIVERTIRELPHLGEMERQKQLKMSQQRIRQTTINFIKRHKLVGKLKRGGN